MKNDLLTLAYIREQTSYPEDYNSKFGYSVHDKGSRFYLIFDAILQSFGTLNRNKRMYEAANILDRIQNDEYIQSMLKNNSWMGELDHPSPTINGQDLSMNRIANPDPKFTSHFIRSPRLNGNLLEARIQTDSSNDNGMNLAIKIVDGKMIPAFSARVLGELQNKDGRPVVNVRKLITYDSVIYPSHPEAIGKINQPIQESVNILENEMQGKIIFFPELAKMVANQSKETEWLCEAFKLNIDDVIGVTDTGNSIVIKEEKNIYVQPLLNHHIREKTKSILTDWLKS
jgi:hypothetical protein